YLPIIIDPEYHHSTINVEAQQNNHESLLWWTKRIISLRKSHQVFGRGEVELLHPENGKVLAFFRHDERSRVLIVANLSRYSQYVELDLSAHAGTVPVELFGGSAFPRIGELPYLLTLGPYGFYWFLFTRPVEEQPEQGLPSIVTTGSWTTLLDDRASRARLERALARWMPLRWIDEHGNMGLQQAAMDLVVRCYARAEARTFVLHGKPYTPDAKRPIPDEVELEKPDLPGLADWTRALGLAGSLFGISLSSRALHADNLKRFEQQLLEALAAVRGPAQRLPEVLAERLRERDIATDAPRLATAESGRALVESLDGLRGRSLVEALA